MIDMLKELIGKTGDGKAAARGGEQGSQGGATDEVAPRGEVAASQATADEPPAVDTQASDPAESEAALAAREAPSLRRSASSVQELVAPDGIASDVALAPLLMSAGAIPAFHFAEEGESDVDEMEEEDEEGEQEESILDREALKKRAQKIVQKRDTKSKQRSRKATK